jgi:hypothetical protein
VSQAVPQRLRSHPGYERVPQVLAYLDPGTGSMLVQLIVGGFAAAGVALKLYWRRFTILFRRNKAGLGSAEPDQDR